MEQILYELWIGFDDADNCEKQATFMNRAVAESIKQSYQNKIDSGEANYKTVWIREIYEPID